ncbi:MAG: hypothetical protein JKY34_16230 [Kordiimonadaceae bacterium]|nr:hypothetical protein [Kordiimonadaceae bacterium]
MTQMLQTFSHSLSSDQLGEFEGLLATASLAGAANKQAPYASRRQRRMTRRRRFV